MEEHHDLAKRLSEIAIGIRSALLTEADVMSAIRKAMGSDRVLSLVSQFRQEIGCDSDEVNKMLAALLDDMEPVIEQHMRDLARCAAYFDRRSWPDYNPFNTIPDDNPNTE